MSRTYLWEVLRRIGLPESFINNIKALYHDITLIPYVNGQGGQQILVESDVRQGDALSCVIFIIVMEPLALALQRSDLLRGIELPNGRTMKCCLYADDTVFFIQALRELLEVNRILEEFEAATGQKINWVKTLLMLLGGLEGITTEELPSRFRAVRLLRPGEAARHLGIPVKHKIGEALRHFWDEMIQGIKERVSSWLRLSQRSRLTIAKTLLISIPVYAVQHLELDKRNQDRIERLQQVLIWGGTRSRLSVGHTRLRKDQGGLAAYDLDAARVAWSIA